MGSPRRGLPRFGPRVPSNPGGGAPSSSTAQLGELYQGGTINADTFVWREGMGDWQMVREVESLRDRLAAPPAAASLPPGDYASAPLQPTNGSHASEPMQQQQVPVAAYP